MRRGGAVYIMTNKNRTVIYIGVTNDLVRRVYEHKTHYNKRSFTHRYNLVYLIYYELFDSIEEAILREKQLKNWHREWKWNLIKKDNPELKDLSEGWYDDL